MLPPNFPQYEKITHATIIQQNIEKQSITVSYLHHINNSEVINVLNIYPNRTSICHQSDKRSCHFENLIVGTKISFVHFTFSVNTFPPQTTAEQIIILNNQN
ncbi:MAG: hypothetical protein ACRCSG_07030 [Cellulosilyticaceae bacterium]